MLQCGHRIIPTPSSVHLPLFSLHPLFHTMSIPMCKGHPGNREPVVDREINKQNGREVMAGRAWWFTGLTTGQPLRSTLQRLQGLQGLRTLLLSVVFVYMFLLLVFSALPLVILSSSLCSLFLFCSLSVLLLHSSFYLPPHLPLLCLSGD